MPGQHPCVRSLAFLTALALGACSSSARAQVLERPSRTVRQELTVTATLLGGYDDNAQAGATGSVRASRSTPGSSGVVDTAVRYRRGSAARSFAATVQSHATSYSSIAGPIVGGDLRLEGRTNLGRFNQLGVDAHLGYSPSFTVGAFGSLDAEVNPGWEF